jgi:hypothetical protein
MFPAFSYWWGIQIKSPVCSPGDFIITIKSQTGRMKNLFVTIKIHIYFLLARLGIKNLLCIREGDGSHTTHPPRLRKMGIPPMTHRQGTCMQEYFYKIILQEKVNRLTAFY